MKTSKLQGKVANAEQSTRSGSPCVNPFCSCDPCRCTTCICGVARLGDLEERVMQHVWQRHQGEVTVRDVADEFREYAYTTIATVMDRLVDKGVLRRRLTKHTKYYVPIGSSGAHTAVLMHEALAADGDQDSALHHFVSGLNEVQLAQLRQALDREDVGRESRH